MTILAARDIGISFGGVKAIDGVSFSVAPSQILSIIGPNGAGKTTLFNVVSGVYESDEGRVELAGEDVTGLTPDRLAARGLSRTFQNLQIFQRMTAAENVMAGRHLRERCNLFADLFRLPSVTRQNRATRAAALALLDDVGLPAAPTCRPARCPTVPASGWRSRVRSRPEPRVLLLGTSRRPLQRAVRDRRDRTSWCGGWRQRASRSSGRARHEARDENLRRVLVLNRGRPVWRARRARSATRPGRLEAYLGQHGAREAARA